MSEATPLKLGGIVHDDRPIVDVFDRAYRLRAITRSVEKGLSKAGREIDALMKEDDADGDQLVSLLADVLDAMLEPEGTNRTKAKTVVMEKWKADDLSLDGLRRFADELQERAVAARPT